MANAHVLISSQTLGSTAASVTFNSFSGYRDLRLVVVSSYNVADSAFIIQFNGDTTNGNYVSVFAQGNGSTTASFTSSSTGAEIGFYPYPNTGLGTVTADIMDYASTDKHKIILTRSGVADGHVRMVTSRWASTAAITSFVLTTSNSAVFSVGSKFYLYGVLA